MAKEPIVAVFSKNKDKAIQLYNSMYICLSEDTLVDVSIGSEVHKVKLPKGLLIRVVHPISAEVVVTDE